MKLQEEINNIDRNIAGIYKIFNTTNNRLYVGSAKSIRRRLQQHLKGLRGGYHENAYIQNDWNKIGPESFHCEILEVVSNIEHLVEREQAYLDIFWDGKKQCYNIRPAAESNRGFKHSEETKRKMSQQRKGKKKPPGTGQKLSKALKGRPGLKGAKSPSSKRVYQYDKFTGNFVAAYESIYEAGRKTGTNVKHISRCCQPTGNERTAQGFIWSFEKHDKVEPYPKYTVTTEHRRAISKKLSGRKLSEEHLKKHRGKTNPNAKPVVQYDLEGNFIRVWDTAKEANDYTGAGRGAISSCCKGRFNTAGGFVWVHKPKDDSLEVAHEKAKLKVEQRKREHQEAIQKMRGGSRKGNKNPRARKVAQYGLKGNLIKTWDYMTFASEKTGTSLSSMYSCCSGISKTANGFIWRFVW